MKNYNVIDYMNDPNIDRRIKEICIQAEKNYIMTNYKTENEKNESNLEFNNFQSNDFNTYNRVDTPKESIHEKISDFNYNEKPFKPISINNYEFNNDLLPNNKLNTNIHNIMNQNKNLNQDYQNSQYSYQNNLNSYENFNLHQNYKNENINENNTMNNSQKNTLRETKSLNLSPEMINTINDSIQLKSTSNLNPKNLSSSLSSIKTNTLINFPHLQINDFQKPILSLNNNCQCFECELRKLIQKKNNLYHKNLKQNTEINKSINKVILEGKYLLSKGKYEECYGKLKFLLEKGLNHPDLFYLYGETCRKLKMMEDSEKYLILCMNFENCSPYVYYSLGLLYEECGQYKYSNYFLKKSLNFFNDSNIFFILSKNYFILNKNLKALKRINEAIDKDNSKIEYLKLRCDIYKKIGRSDLSKNDEMMIEFINRKKYHN